MIPILGLSKLNVVCFIAAASLTVVSRGDDFKGFPNLSDEALDLLKTLDNLPTSLNVSDFPSIDEGEEKIKKMCIKNGLNTSFENFLNVRDETLDCLEDVLNYAEMEEEINEADAKGDLQDVSQEYCKKLPKLKGCMLDFTIALEPCLEKSDKASKTIVQNIMDSSLDLMCQKRGCGFALFFAEGGPECISAKGKAIGACFNSTFTNYTPPDSKEGTIFPPLKLGPQECQDVFKFQKCVVKELETCPNLTTANMVDSLIDYAFQETSCSCYNPKPWKRAPGCPSDPSSFDIFMHLFLLVIYLLICGVLLIPCFITPRFSGF